MSATNQAGAGDVAAFQAGTTGDPFPSWREGASKQAILDLVQRVTADGGDARFYGLPEPRSWSDANSTTGRS